MKKWVKAFVMILVGAGVWLVLDYFYYGTLDGMNLLGALLFGVAMWGVELIFYKKKRKE